VSEAPEGKAGGSFHLGDASEGSRRVLAEDEGYPASGLRFCHKSSFRKSSAESSVSDINDSGDDLEYSPSIVPSGTDNPLGDERAVDPSESGEIFSVFTTMSAHLSLGCSKADGRLNTSWDFESLLQSCSSHAEPYAAADSPLETSVAELKWPSAVPNARSRDEFDGLGLQSHAILSAGAVACPESAHDASCEAA